MKKRILSLVMAFAFVLPMVMGADGGFILNAKAEGVFTSVKPVVKEIKYNEVSSHINAPEPWDGVTKTEPAGEGTEESPFLISSGAELAWFAQYVNEANSANQYKREAKAKLIRDIDLNNKDWFNYRIGPSWNYVGVFDGQGHTIYNLYINHASGQPGGLFMRVGLTGKNTTIKNINFVNTNIIADIEDGITYTTGYSVLAGRIDGADTLIDNITLSGKMTVAGDKTTPVHIAGGVAGLLIRGTISNCYSDMEYDFTNALNSQTTYSSGASDNAGIGGIVGKSATSASTGYTITATIKNCGFEGTINAPQNSRVAGIVGAINSKTYNALENCYNNGDITGYRQVAGIAAWAYEGTYSELVPKGIYNTGKITAKTSDKAYASGLINGLRGTRLTYPAYSSGDVVIEENGQTLYNGYCGLLYTNASATPNWESTGTALYNSKYSSKATLGANGVALASSGNIKAVSDEEFINGTAISYLNNAFSEISWENVKGLNKNFPVTSVNSANPLANGYTYYLENESLPVILDEPGIVEFSISPVGENVTVTVGNTTYDVALKNVYSFDVDTCEFDIEVSGKAFVEKKLANQIKETQIDEIVPGIIEVKFEETTPRTVILGLYKDKKLIDISYNVNVQPQLIDDVSYVKARINTNGIDTTDCVVKAFLWKNNSLEPLSQYDYIGKYDGVSATKAEMQLAVATVAESYLNKGAAIQYDNSVMSSDGIERATVFENSPEDYSYENIGYTNEVAFYRDVYYEALKVKLPETINEIAENPKAVVLSGTPSSENYELYKSQINIGDIIYLESSSDVKIMLVTGSDELIYAEGKSYDYQTGTDYTEQNGALNKDAISNLFTNENDLSVLKFDNIKIIRPLDTIKEIPLPVKTKLRVDNMQGINVEKTASLSRTHTIQPGEDLTYTIKIENNGQSEKTVTVKDEIPLNTTCTKDELSWDVTVAPGETKSVSYTVTVNDDTALCGKYIESNKATVEGVSVGCYPVYVARTLNQTDRNRIDTAIQALNYSEFEGDGFSGHKMLNAIYTVGLTRAYNLTASAENILKQIYVDEIGVTEGISGSGEEAAAEPIDLIKTSVPAMFGGKKVTKDAEEMFDIERARSIKEDDLIIGDVVLLHENISDSETAKLYIYDGEYLVEPLAGGMTFNDPDKIINKLLSCDRFLVLRPSASISNLNNFPEEKELDLTPAQEAIIETAKAFMMRGGRLQYDDLVMFTNTDYRWSKGKRKPEDYTTTEWGYTNCAVFTYEAYYHGLNYDIEYWNTGGLNGGTNFHVYSHVNTYNPASTDSTNVKPSQETQDRVKKEVYETLQPGDIIVVRRFTQGSGHAMLYIGNGTIIHSGGKNYNTASSLETYEPTIRFKNLEDLFTEGDTCHLFGKVQYMKICRPLDKWTGTVPENSVNRVKNMKGIVAEKISSHSSTTTVNPGEEISYTYSIYNTNKTDVTLNITDVVPDNATYIEGAQTVNGNNLLWTVKVPAREKVEVTYKIKVNDDADYETYVDNSKGKVGGVMVRCPDVLIKRTLTNLEQESIVSAIKEQMPSSLSGAPLANEIYRVATGKENVLYDYNNDGVIDYTDITSGVFKETTRNSKTGFEINRDETYGKIVVPSLYGGRKFNSVLFSTECIGMGKKHNLVVGDILVGRTLSATLLYIYDGENFINLSTKVEYEPNQRLMKCLGYGNCYAVLRPSFGF